MINFLLSTRSLAVISLIIANIMANKKYKDAVKDGKDKQKYSLVKPLFIFAAFLLAICIFTNNRLINTFEMATFIALPAVGLLVCSFLYSKDVEYKTYLTAWTIVSACAQLYFLIIFLGFARTILNWGGAYSHTFTFRAFYLIILAQLLFKCIMDCKEKGLFKLIKNKLAVGVACVFMVASLGFFGNMQGIEMSSTSQESYLSDITYVYNKDGTIKHNEDGERVTKNHYDTKTVVNTGVVGYFYFIAAFGILSTFAVYFINRPKLAQETNVDTKETIDESKVNSDKKS